MAMNSAPSSRYSTASEAITPISETALEMGCVCTTTLTAQTTAMMAKIRNRMTSISRDPRDEKASDQQVHQRHRKKHFPRKAHQLVVAEPGKRSPDPDIKEQN